MGAIHGQRRVRWRRRWTLRLCVAACALVAVTFVAAANYTPVDLRLPGWHGDVRLGWSLFGSAAVGFILGAVVTRRR